MKYPEEFQFVKSNKGHDKLVYENYVYTLNTKRETYRSWRCEKRRQCKARIDYNGKTSKIKKGLWDHSHEADPARIEMLRVKAEMKVMALSDKEADADTIFRKVTDNSSPEVVKKLSVDVCKRNINRFKTLTHKMLSSADSTTDSLENPERKEDSQPTDDFQDVEIKVEPDIEDLEFISKKLPSFLKSQKGKKKLTWKGYVYNLDRKKPGKHFWKCEKRRICSGRVICSEGVVELSKMHTHPPDTTRIKKLKILEKVRAEVLSTDDPENSTKILENVMKKVSSDISNLMSAEKMRNTIRYVRKKRLQTPSSADFTSCAEEKSEDEMQFRLPKVPQVPKSAAKKSKGLPLGLKQGGIKTVEDKENQENSENDEVQVNFKISESEEENVEPKVTGKESCEPLNTFSGKLRQRLMDDFTPKLKELREKILEQVEQMMINFEDNFFNYLLSITEDSATVLTDRYQSPNNTITSENDDDSEEDCEDEELDKVIEEEDSEDSEKESENSESEYEEDDYEIRGRLNLSANLKGKGRGKPQPKAKPKISLNVSTRTTRSSIKILPPVKSPEGPNTRKRKPPHPPPCFDYDSTDESNLPHNRIPPPKSKLTPLRKLSNATAGSSSPKKKRKTSENRKIPARKSEGSYTVTTLNSTDEDSLLEMTEDDATVLSSILLPEEIKLESDSNSCLGEPQGTIANISQMSQETGPSNSLELSQLSSIVGIDCNFHLSLVNPP